MPTVLQEIDSLAEMLHSIGDIPPERVLLGRGLGSATVSDVLKYCEGEPKRLVELVDGVLVEKIVGNREARFALELGCLLRDFLRAHDLGFLTGADGPHQLAAGVVRLPDISFIPWTHIPPGADIDTPVPDWVPALAVEVISPSNTRAEMEHKLRDYFTAGVELVWYIYPEKRAVHVYSSPEAFVALTESDVLDGGTVLPGFQVSVHELFRIAQYRGPRSQE